MTPRKPCPRCGRPRAIQPTRATDHDNPHGLCRDCKTVEPGWPTTIIPPCSDSRANPKPFIDPDDLADGLLAVTKLLAAHADQISDHRVRIAAARARITCGQCGCLTFADEPCPRCRIRALGISHPIAPRSEVGHALIRSTLDGG